MHLEKGGTHHDRGSGGGLRRAFLWILDLLFPRLCPLCGSPTELSICEGCIRGLYPCEEPLCPRCGLPYPLEATGHLCSACLRGDYPFVRHRSYGLYEGVLREAIHRFKYRGDRSLLAPLGEMALEAFRRLEVQPDFILPVPLDRKKLLQRGFNQSLLLARYISRCTGIPCKEGLLVKCKETPSQTSLGGKERRTNLRGAFALREEEVVRGKRVLVVDDVFTTGATISEISRVLLKAKAKEVFAVTLARSL